MWVGWKRKKKQKKHLHVKILQGKQGGHEKRCFTLECKQGTSTVERPGTSMLAWIQSCSGQLRSENRRRASRSRTCPLMHLLKPKCQEKGLQKLLCTSDVLQMGAQILYPPSFKPPPPTLPLIQMLEGWLLKKTSKTLNPVQKVQKQKTLPAGCFSSAICNS